MRIPLSNVNLTDIERRLAADALKTGWISGTGHYVTDFEHGLAERVHRLFAVACCNGTVALEIALRALGIGPGDEVIVPALTFVAPAAAARNVGAKPILADVTEESWTIEPIGSQSISVSRQTAAIIMVDLLGHPCDAFELRDFSDESHIPIIEDAAEAHGAIYHDRILQKDEQVGSMGDISTFSFHANKTITTGEGGAILTDDLELAHEIRLRVNHGMTPERPYWHDTVGTNARMTNLTAAIGVGQVQRWDELVTLRNQVAARYDERLADLFANTPLYRRPVASWATEACWLYTVAHPERQPIIDALRGKGIDARPIWTALCDLPIYRESCRGEYPVARKIAREAFWIPTYAGMSDSAIDEVCEIIHDSIRQPIR